MNETSGEGGGERRLCHTERATQDVYKFVTRTTGAENFFLYLHSHVNGEYHDSFIKDQRKTTLM